MSEAQNKNNVARQDQQQQHQQQPYPENKTNSAESEKLYIKMKEGWL